MADPIQVALLRQGAIVWNSWRRGKNIAPSLSGVNFDGADLSGVDLSGADLQHTSFIQAHLNSANLSAANLQQALLTEAQLVGSNLRGASLSGTDLVAANLNGANLAEATVDAADLSWASLVGTSFFGADLTLTRFRSANMQRANLTNASLDGTLFADINLADVTGLATCIHEGSSIVDHSTLQISGNLPIQFLRGIGLQEALIMSLPHLYQIPKYYTCFISYSHKDRKFAEKLQWDLTRAGIQSYFAPHDMPIGRKVLDEIDREISIRDRLLLIASRNSIESDWVEDEVTKAFEEERKRGHEVLFPIRLDDSIMKSTEPWAAKLRARHIGDFRRWTTTAAYEESFERVRRDLLRPPSIDVAEQI
jgi:hypothetical protein